MSDSSIAPMRDTRISVTFVIQKLAGLTGGAERVFVETAEAMSQKGMNVRMVTFDPDKSESFFGKGQIPAHSLFPTSNAMPSGRTLKLAVQVLKRLPSWAAFNKLKWRRTHQVFARALKEDLLQHPAHVVVAFLPPAITAAAVATEDTCIKLIASTHNVPELDFGDSPRWDQNPIYRSRARRALSEAAAITTTMTSFIAWFPADIQPHVHHLPNPVKRLSPEAKDKKREKVIIGVGRLTSIKRWDLLIRAFARICDTVPEWKLQIYGEGPEHAALKMLIEKLGIRDKAQLVGVTPNIGEVYDKASLLVHPSEFEGFGLSVAEAMAHGLPAIAFADCEGVRELIKHDENGILIAQVDDKELALARVVLDIVDNEQRRSRLGEKAKEISTTFNADDIYHSWATLLQSIARPLN